MSELYDSVQAVTIQIVPVEMTPITAWEVEAALRQMKNWKEPGKDQVNIETGVKTGVKPSRKTSQAVHKVQNRTTLP